MTVPRNKVQLYTALDFLYLCWKRGQAGLRQEEDVVDRPEVLPSQRKDWAKKLMRIIVVTPIWTRPSATASSETARCPRTSTHDEYGTMDHSRDPCPWVILNDFGGAFAMGVCPHKLHVLALHILTANRL
jgi:hypothetical protein